MGRPSNINKFKFRTNPVTELRMREVARSIGRKVKTWGSYIPLTKRTLSDLSTVTNVGVHSNVRSKHADHYVASVGALVRKSLIRMSETSRYPTFKNPFLKKGKELSFQHEVLKKVVAPFKYIYDVADSIAKSLAELVQPDFVLAGFGKSRESSYVDAALDVFREPSRMSGKDGERGAGKPDSLEDSLLASTRLFGKVTLGREKGGGKMAGPESSRENGDVGFIPFVDDGKSIAYNVRGSELKVEEVISALEAFFPHLLRSLNELTPDRSSTASLNITVGKGELQEVYIELQSRDGGVWADSFLLKAETRNRLIDFLNNLLI